jgi:hypothetical protein
MVLCRTRIPRLASRGLLPLCLLALAVACTYGPARAAGTGEAKPSGSNERLRALMTQRVEILQRAVKNSELYLNAGRTDLLIHQNLLVALHRAQADLGTTTAERIKVYEKLVEVLAALEETLERMGDAGRYTADQVTQGKLVTLNARIDLEKLRLGLE